MKKVFLIVISAFLALIVLASTLVYIKQEAIVQKLITTANKDFAGKIALEKSKISLFAAFPYISIDLQGLSVYGSKKENEPPILKLQDCYIGFDLFSILAGNMEIKAIKLKGGTIKLIQDLEGNLNLLEAFKQEKEIEDVNEEFNLYLQKIEADDIYVSKINLTDSVEIGAQIHFLKTRLKTKENIIESNVDTKFHLNVIRGMDTTFVKNKSFEIVTGVVFDQNKNFLKVEPSKLTLEKGTFTMHGSIDIEDSFNLNLNFSGKKNDFDLLIAFAPEEVVPTLESFRNKGEVYFDAKLNGKSVDGNAPFFMAEFGCIDGYFENKETQKKLDELTFKGFFTNGENKDNSTMQFAITEFSARPEEGIFTGNFKVTNFVSPEIETQIRSDFNLEFLAQFLNVEQLQNLRGKVALTMNFRDIIDLQNPEKSIEKFNESYFTELEVENLGFTLPDYHLPFRNINIKAVMDGNEAKISKFNFKLGKSDLSIIGSVSDLPAVIHHTNQKVVTNLTIKSTLLDLYELTNNPADTTPPINEEIQNLSVSLALISSAKALTESPNLPEGEFLIKEFNAKLKNYPHAFHDFFANLKINEKEISIQNFKGEIDSSDFNISGSLHNYALFLKEKSKGDAKLNFNITSNLLKLKDLLHYDTLNYMPEDYRDEELRNLILAGKVNLILDDSLKAIDLALSKMQARLLVHPLKIEKVRGNFHYEDSTISTNDFSITMGESELNVDLKYNFSVSGEPNANTNFIRINSPRLNFDQLFAYEKKQAEIENTDEPVNHQEAYNLFEIPFPNLKIDATIKHLNYHRYLIKNFVAKGKINENHFVLLDTIGMRIAGGDLSIQGYFTGENPELIYFNPIINAKEIDLDQLLIKFSNFGQDNLVSDNLQGKLTGKVTGKIRMFPDLVPDLDNSNLEIDVRVLNGTLKNYEPLNAMSSYFADRNLAKVRFDTLANKLSFNEGILSIPSMTIASSLGYIELSGRQDMDMNMDYYFRIPWRMVSSVAGKKLFGRKPNEEIDADQIDEIVFRDPKRKTRFINLRMRGNPDDFNISLGKDKN
jgi:hypothetical protein